MSSVPLARCGSDEPHVAHSIWRPHMYYCAGNINVVEALVEGEPVKEANQPEPLTTHFPILYEPLAHALCHARGELWDRCPDHNEHYAHADKLLDFLAYDDRLLGDTLHLLEDDTYSTLDTFIHLFAAYAE